MIIRLLSATGKYILYLLSGMLIGQSIGHLRLATAASKETLQGLKSIAASPFMAAIVTTHIGNAIYGLSLLFIAALILLLLKYEFKLKLSSLFLFIGFAANFIMLALMFDK
jgi:hypothetical protein